MPKRKNEDAPYWRCLRKAEADMIEHALGECGTISNAARALGISVNYLSERVRTLGVPAPTRSSEPPPKVKKRRARRAQEKAQKAQEAQQEVRGRTEAAPTAEAGRLSLVPSEANEEADEWDGEDGNGQDEDDAWTEDGDADEAEV